MAATSTCKLAFAPDNEAALTTLVEGFFSRNAQIEFEHDGLIVRL